MNRHPGGEEHTREMLLLSGLKQPSRVLDMGAGEGEAVRLLRSMGYEALGIDINPRDPDVEKKDFLSSGLPAGTFDGILSQCSFFISGSPNAALKEAYRLLKAGGILMLSDIWFTDSLKAAADAGFNVILRRDLTPLWKEYYIEAIWRGDADCVPVRGKCTYEMLICRKD